MGFTTPIKQGTTSAADSLPAGTTDALAGSSGTPSSSNKFVTDADSRNTNARTPSTHASSHAGAGSDPVTSLGACSVTGTQTFSGATGTNKIAVPDNLASAFQIAEGAQKYLEIVSTDGSEKITLGAKTTIDGTPQHTDSVLKFTNSWTGTCAINFLDGACAITIPGSRADAFNISNGSNGDVHFAFDSTARKTRTGVPLQDRRWQLAKAVDYPVTDTDCGTTFTNTGASGAIVLTLPTPAAGQVYRAIVTVAQFVRFTATGSAKIYLATVAGATNGYVRINTIGASIEMESNGTDWFVTQSVGTWLQDV